MTKEEIDKFKQFYPNGEECTFTTLAAAQITQLIISELTADNDKKDAAYTELKQLADEMALNHIRLLEIAKHYIKNHDYFVIENAETIINKHQKIILG